MKEKKCKASDGNRVGNSQKQAALFLSTMKKQQKRELCEGKESILTLLPSKIPENEFHVKRATDLKKATDKD